MSEALSCVQGDLGLQQGFPLRRAALIMAQGSVDSLPRLPLQTLHTRPEFMFAVPACCVYIWAGGDEFPPSVYVCVGGAEWPGHGG